MFEVTSLDMASKWAEFSGDFNPIHFDLDAAKSAGAERLIVHGMLALLPIKQEMSERFSGDVQPLTEWRRFKAFFRTPLHQDSLPSLSFTDRSSGAGFVLQESGNEICRGFLCPQRDAIEGQRPFDRKSIEAGKVQVLRRQFFDNFPFVKKEWIFLDAVVFSSFLKQELPRLQKKAERMVAVQVSHEVIFRRDIPEGALNEEITYSVRRTESESTSGGSGLAQIDVMSGGNVLMRVEISLLAKRIPARH